MVGEIISRFFSIIHIPISLQLPTYFTPMIVTMKLFLIINKIIILIINTNIILLLLLLKIIIGALNIIYQRAVVVESKCKKVLFDLTLHLSGSL